MLGPEPLDFFAALALVETTELRLLLLTEVGLAEVVEGEDEDDDMMALR